MQGGLDRLGHVDERALRALSRGGSRFAQRLLNSGRKYVEAVMYLVEYKNRIQPIFVTAYTERDTWNSSKIASKCFIRECW